MSSEWAKNIPENGILCKTVRFGWDIETVIIKGIDDRGVLLDERNYLVGAPEDFTPLTPQEVWALMPWQPMDRLLPDKDKKVLIKDRDGQVFFGTIGEDDESWLPLPEIKQ